MKKLLVNLKVSILTLLLCLAGTGRLWAETVTYTITSNKACSTSGTAPEGSTASYSQTYTGNNGQMTAGNSTTLTLTGFYGMKIQGIKLKMKSNSAKGAGKFKATAGTTTLAEIASATNFNNFFDNTSYGTNYRDVTVTMSNTTYVVKDGENVVIKIEGTTNSLYVSSYTITYISDTPAKTLSSIAVSGESPELWKNGSFSHEGITVTATYSDNSTADVTSSATFTAPDMKTAGDNKTVTVSYGGKSTSYTVNVKTIENTVETAYTTAKAIELIKAKNDLTTQVYVKGTISKIDGFNEKYSTITYWLDDNAFEIYSGKGLKNTDFTSASDIATGKEVVVYGQLDTFGSTTITYELAKNNYLVVYDGKTEPEGYTAPSNKAPEFTTQPQSKSVKKGSSASLSVKVAGTPSPTVQWYKNTTNSTEGGTAISSATSTTYSLPTSAAGITYYYCVATNSEGSVASDIAKVSVLEAGSITKDYVYEAIAGQSVQFTLKTTNVGGELSVMSKNTDVATASIEGNVITINALKQGTASIVLNAGETETYYPANSEYSFKVIAPASEEVSFNGGKSDVEKSTYMSGLLLGSDYPSAPKLKFDDENDYLTIAYGYSAATVKFTIKGNSFENSGTFDVLESTDNKTYTLAKRITSLPSGTSVDEYVDLKADSRFIKFYFTKKAGNVALGSIVVSKTQLANTKPGESAAIGTAAWTAETYKREVATGKYSTICLPFAAKVEGAVVYNMAGKNLNGANVESITFELTGETEEESNTLKAGVPYLYRATANEQTFTKTGTKSYAVAPTKNLTGFKGTYRDFELPAGSYFLYNSGSTQEFRPAAEYASSGRTYVNIGAFKCYISSFDDIQETPAASNARNRITISGFAETSTGIFTLDTENIKANDGKFVENGSIVIIRNGVKYNTKGQIIK